MEPDWVAEERRLFHDQRDQDGDGFLSFAEVTKELSWIMCRSLYSVLSGETLDRARGRGPQAISEQLVFKNYFHFMRGSVRVFAENLAVRMLPTTAGRRRGTWWTGPMPTGTASSARRRCYSITIFSSAVLLRGTVTSSAGMTSSSAVFFALFYS